MLHDDVIKWKHFPRSWLFVRGIHRWPVNSPHKGQWRGALMFSLICARINRWVNNREAGDLRRYRTHYDVIVITPVHSRHITDWLMQPRRSHRRYNFVAVTRGDGYKRVNQLQAIDDLPRVRRLLVRSPQRAAQTSPLELNLHAFPKWPTKGKKSSICFNLNSTYYA